MSEKETSAGIASLAARALSDPGSLSHDEIKSLAGSALSQRELEPTGIEGVFNGTCRICQSKTLLNADGRCLSCYTGEPVSAPLAPQTPAAPTDVIVTRALDGAALARVLNDRLRLTLTPGEATGRDLAQCVINYINGPVA